jgi:bifunctional DNA-binding transcriptional regulator/antitoxin component of YhaV-PrlF toxin-antitoxin module
MPSQTSTVAPINTALLGAATGDTGRVDLSGLWTEPADPAAPRSSMVLRRLDDKGRLTVPIEPSADLRLPAERVGAVLTLFLPGSGEAPAPGRVVANVPLRTKGRITLPAPIRDHLGLPPSADVLVMFDPERHVLRICAASRLEASVAAGLDSLASSGHSTAPPVGNTGPEQLRALPRPA